MTLGSSATDVLREAVRSRKMSSSLWARNLGISGEALHNFSHGNGALPDDVKCAITLEVWPHGRRFDPATDRFVAIAPPQRAAPVAPPPFDPATVPKWVPTNPIAHAPQPVKPAPTQPRKLRPGFAE